MKPRTLSEEEREALRKYTFDISLCLSDMPKCMLHKADSGKVYASITVAVRKNLDQWNRDIKVSMTQTKKQREDGLPRTYVGGGKVYRFCDNEEMKVRDEDLSF